MEDEENIEEELLLVESELHGLQDKIKMLLDRQEELYERQSQLQALLEISKTSRDAASSAPSVAPEDWSGKFSWDSQADDIRFNVFGISSYRSNQREIINSIMSGKDVLVIMAAGGGKSLCYQLPAVLRDGIALVVSPLLSLIQDQVMGLTALGIPAYMLTSTTNKEVEKLIYKALEKGEGELKILYVTPEKISKSKRFMSKLEKCHHAGRLSLVAIDEAHCCSQWGHDFRPDYKNLGILKIQFPSVPMIALTATATSKVQMDLIEMLHIPRCVKFVSTVNRPNLYYKVYEKSSVGKVVIDEIANFITESYPNKESGIVYCFSRKECEQVAKELRERGIAADYYHADMDSVAREKVHMRWHLEWESTNQTSGLWFIIALASLWRHTTRLPRLQESGRAGRDGLPSECVLYYRPGDVPRQSSMVFYENCGLQNLYDIVRYCQSKKSCRRGAFFQHFGEAVQECNGMCDNCASSIELKDIDATYHTKIIVSLLQDMQHNDQRATLLQLVDKFKTKWKHSGCSNEAVDLKKEEIEQLIVQLIIDRVLKEEFQHTAYTTNAYVALGPLWKLALQGNRPVKLTGAIHSQDTGGASKSTKRSQMSNLEAKLDDLRRTISSDNGGIFPHAVLSTQQISLLSSHKPTTIAELENLIGKVKADKYGSDIIEVMQSEIDGGKDSGENGAKRQKKDKDVVLVESSEEEA
ncbi:mediator of RNA polymerase II transcription subunit 34 isoform X2 [Brachypodium distachyon]|uniref:mediator of RNA polymerase II transcription subunit 34 isoform X2 n=1 Tax=Brachypodium distachyon TaxID=15368 RepID=UPI000D0D0775|nr:mediator of RNA polymerase II transcription subunit 34 isoform X2 [Brachypodium distachyon]|eukprot:XP_024317349.1 mediator of RNA polymerase II transcription subunit 34 isoform X2 [Brachypodium distachyon]